MKKIITLVFMSAVLALTSCNDFLDKAPDDQLTMEMIFTDYLDILMKILMLRKWN